MTQFDSAIDIAKWPIVAVPASIAERHPVRVGKGVAIVYPDGTPMSTVYDLTNLIGRALRDGQAQLADPDWPLRQAVRYSYQPGTEHHTTSQSFLQ